MDDEEFVGSGQKAGGISLADVADLVTFLKNLGFTLYFHSADLRPEEDRKSSQSDPAGLSRYFGNTGRAHPIERNEPKPKPIAGLTGLTTEYLKGLVTSLSRAIYDRDSRRQFLPADHWLLTSVFDMTSFIPSVVAEEQSRHQVQELEGGESESESEDDGDDSSVRTTGALDSSRSSEARARAQRRISRRRYLEAVAPRLEILQNVPFIIPFVTRVEIFRHFVELDQFKRRHGFTDPDAWRHYMMTRSASHGGMLPHARILRHHAKIRRKHEFEDAFDQFYELGVDFKEPIQISFVDEYDIPEAGIDGGGKSSDRRWSKLSLTMQESRRSY